MTAPAIYVIAALELEGETGWMEAPESDVQHGRLVLVRGNERITFSHRSNGGDPAWRAGAFPRRLRKSAALEMFRFMPKREER